MANAPDGGKKRGGGGKNLTRSFPLSIRRSRWSMGRERGGKKRGLILHFRLPHTCLALKEKRERGRETFLLIHHRERGEKEEGGLIIIFLKFFDGRRRKKVPWLSPL